MRNMTATEAVRGFSEVIDKVQDEPVTIERNGRPVAVVYSHSRAMELEALEQKEMKAAVQEGIRDVEVGRYQPFTRDLVDQIKNEVLEELKGK